MTRVGHGIIEGFYGRPWSTADRVAIVRRLGEVGLETFIVAPKNDPRGFQRPRRAAADFADISEVARAGRDAKVRVFVSACADNVEPLVDAGVDGIVISLDDTWTTFAPGLATFGRGEAHGALAREALRRATARSRDARVLLVPAIYHRRAEDLGRGAIAYLRGIAAATDVPVAWTGPAIFSRSITPADFARLREASGLTFWLWNNAITNDWLPLATGELLGARPYQKLSFGSVDNMSPGLEREVDGILLNAAREPALTHVSALCLAAWLRDPMHHAPVDAALAAIRDVGAEDARLLEIAHDLTRNHPLSAPSRFEASAIADAVADYLAGRAAAARIQALLRELVDASARAARSDHDAVRECAPTLDRAGALAEAALVTIARREGGAIEKQRARELAIERDQLLRRARRARWQVGLGCLQPLLSAPLR